MEFTEEQKKIVELLAKGKSNPKIMLLLFLSRRTLQRRLEELYDGLSIEGSPTEKRTYLVSEAVKIQQNGIL